MSEPFQWTRVVEFHETDAAGLVHFSNYYRWMESAEHAYLKSKGVDVCDGKKGWPRVHAHCDFKKPIRAGELVVIKVIRVEQGSTSLTYTFEIVSENQQCALGKMTTVCVDLTTMKPMKIETPLSLESDEIT